MIERYRNVVTEGISPKAIAAAAGPLIAGVVLMVLDLASLVDVDDTLWLGLLGVAPVAGGAAAAAGVGTVKRVVRR